MKSVYLGDQACKRIELDTWAGVLTLQFSAIVRIRNPDAGLDLSTDECLPDARLVFHGVTMFQFDGDGKLPNDLVDDVSVTQLSDDSATVVFVISSVDGEKWSQARLQLQCGSVTIVASHRRPND